ncbi:MAG: DUF4810 domain-containing protein [Desulfuromonadales bacterium]
MKKLKYCFVMATILVLTGCVPQTKYAWNGYDQKLYDHYKNPTESEQFVVTLKEVIEYGENVGKVPPGIYAEYGYVLYEKGNFNEAILYFKKEQDKWSESKVLMTKMISNANKIAAQNEKRKESTTEKSVPITGDAK